MKGSNGPGGNKGFKGNQGDQGAKGPNGITGDRGTQGTQGAIGYKGVNGGNGPVGPNGPTGNQGARGVQGNAGPVGDTGVQGVQGNQGTQGAIGYIGYKGVQGHRGVQGASRTGHQGFRGNQGIIGSKGFQGAYGGAHFALSTSGTQIIVTETGGNDRYSIEKRSGSNGWNEHAYSPNSQGAGYPVTITFTAQETNSAKMMGLNSDPLANTSYNTIDYAFYPYNGGGVHIYENGSAVAYNVGSYDSATVFAITYTDTFIKYYMDGVLKRSVPTYTGRSFHVDSSIHDVWGGFDDIKFYRGSTLDGIPRGYQGNTGPTGAQGTRGAQGSASSTSGGIGTQGAKGSIGTGGGTGSRGSQGSRGPQGIAGQIAGGTFAGTLMYSTWSNGSGSGSRTIQNGLIK